MTDGTTRDDAARNPEDDRAEPVTGQDDDGGREDAAVDKADEESFPASDAPSTWSGPPEN